MRQLIGLILFLSFICGLSLVDFRLGYLFRHIVKEVKAEYVPHEPVLLTEEYKQKFMVSGKKLGEFQAAVKREKLYQNVLVQQFLRENNLNGEWTLNFQDWMLRKKEKTDVRD